MTARQLNIEDRTYYFYNDKNKPSDWKANSVNPLYMLINRVHGIVSEKNGFKFLSIEKGDAVLKKYDQVFAGIKHHIKKISDEKVNFNSDYDKIKFLTDDSLPLGKLIYFPTTTVVIRCVFKQDDIYYPQVCLDDCLYQI